MGTPSVSPFGIEQPVFPLLNQNSTCLSQTAFWLTVIHFDWIILQHVNRQNTLSVCWNFMPKRSCEVSSKVISVSKRQVKAYELEQEGTCSLTLLLFTNSYLCSLQTLVLGHKAENLIPSEIGCLCSLQTLVLECRKDRSAVPAALFRLTQLKCLTLLRYDWTQTAASAVSRLCNLEMLKCTTCNVSRLQSLATSLNWRSFVLVETTVNVNHWPGQFQPKSAYSREWWGCAFSIRFKPGGFRLNSAALPIWQNYILTTPCYLAPFPPNSTCWPI